MDINEDKAENSPAGGVLIGKKDGQTIIHDKGTMSGYLVGKLHKDGGIKAVNKATGQPLEMQGGEIIITAPAVSDQTKHNFNGKMMTNREILSKINSDGGGVSFADGGDIPAKIHTTDKEYEYGGKMVHDSDIAHSLGMNSTLKKGKQHFSAGGKTYDVDAIYNAIKKGKLKVKTKEVPTFAMKYPVYDKKYSETVKTDFRKPNGITVRTESDEEILIDGNHRMNNAYLKGKKTMKTYYIEDPKQIAKFIKKNKFELGGNITIKKDPIELIGSKVKIDYKGGIYGDKNTDKKYLKTFKGANSERKQFGKITNVKRIGNSNKPNIYDDYSFEITFDDNQKDNYKIKEIQFYDQNNNYLNPSFSSVKLYVDGGHLSKNKSLKQISEMHNVSLTHVNEELAKGLEVEKEHFNDFKERTRVAKDHLVENPNYYTILEKAGLKRGGAIEKQDLVKDAKSGNSPARDLNNYNDLMDVQADEVAGGDSGIFANGGETNNYTYISDLGEEDLKLYDRVSNIRNSEIHENNRYYTYLGISIYTTSENRNNIFVENVDKVFNNYVDAENYIENNEVGESKIPLWIGTEKRYYELYPNKKRIYNNGGLTPYDANAEGNSIAMLDTGGGVGLPKVVYVKVSNTGASLTKLMGLKYNSFKEFKESVQEAYKPFVNINPIRRSFVEIEAYDENGKKLVNASTYIADQKNTVKNFNPTTGNYKNLEKSLANSRPRSFQKFDWEDWFLSKVKPSISTIQTPTSSNLPEYYEFTQEVKTGFTKGKIYKIKNPSQIGASGNFIDDEGTVNGYGSNNSSYFKPSTEQAFLAQKGMTSGSSNLPLDLSDTKVWIGDDSKLSEEIQKVAFELGWRWSGGQIVQYTNTDALYFNAFKSIGYKVGGRTVFDANANKEINPQDILLAKRAVITTSSASSGSNKSFDFTDTKIDVRNNSDLSQKVQKRAFELGWEWESRGGKTIDYNAKNYLYFTKRNISDGITTSSFRNSPKREITEAEIFGSQTSATTNISQVSNLAPYEASKVTLEWKNKLGILVYRIFITDNLLSGQEFINQLKSIEKDSNGKDVEVVIQANAKDSNGNDVERRTEFTIGETWFKPSTRTNEQIKSIVANDIIDGITFDKFFEDVIPLSGNQTPTQYKPVDLSDTKIWIGDNPELSKRIQEKAFESGYKWSGLDNFVQLTEKYALYFIGGSKEIMSGSGDYKLFNEDSSFKEITEEDIFGIKNTISKPVVPKNIIDKKFTDFKEAVSALEGFASQASKKYNTPDYEDSLQLFKEVKEEYSLALSFTPESSFMYERIELMKKINEVQKEITRITELKNGGAYYILAKVIDRLEKDENWKDLGVGEIMINEVPEQEIESIIYTEKFKNWFGDWEQALITKEYDYVSKALSVNGKPSVMFHGAKRIKYSYRQVSNGVLYLAENRSYAEWFSSSESPYQKQGDYLTQCFVNIKNPIDLTVFGVEEVDLRDIIQFIDTVYPLAKIYDVLPPNTAMAIMNNQLIGRNFRAWYIIRQFPELNKHIRDNTDYDGFIYYENNPSDVITSEITGQLQENVTKATAVFNSNQVKLVDAMLFDASLDDWRFEQGGKVNQ